MTAEWTTNRELVRGYRQAATLAGIANGKTSKEMASEAGVSPRVVDHAVDTLFFKFGLGRGRRAALVAEAIRQGALSTMPLLMLVVVTLVALHPIADMNRVSRRSTSRLTVRSVRTARSGSRIAHEWIDLDIIVVGEIV